MMALSESAYKVTRMTLKIMAQCQSHFTCPLYATDYLPNAEQLETEHGTDERHGFGPKRLPTDVGIRPDPWIREHDARKYLGSGK